MKAYLLVKVQGQPELAPDVLQVVGVVQAHAVYGGPYDIICFAEAEDVRGLYEIRDTIGAIPGVFSVQLAPVKEEEPSLLAALIAREGGVFFIPTDPQAAKDWVAWRVKSWLLPEGTTWIQLRNALLEAGFSVTDTLTSGEARWTRG